MDLRNTQRKQEKLKDKILGYMAELTEAISMDSLYDRFCCEWTPEADLHTMGEVHGATLELISSGKLKFCTDFRIVTPRLHKVLEEEKGNYYRRGEILAATHVNDGEPLLEGIWRVKKDFNEGVMRKLLKCAYQTTDTPRCIFQLLAHEGYLEEVRYIEVKH